VVCRNDQFCRSSVSVSVTTGYVRRWRRSFHLPDPPPGPEVGVDMTASIDLQEVVVFHCGRRCRRAVPTAAASDSSSVAGV
jgi:hypothetical protein